MVFIWVSLSAVGIGFFFMIFMKYCSGIVVWLFLIVYFLALIALTWGFFQKSRGKSVFDTEDFEKLADHAKGLAGVGDDDASTGTTFMFKLEDHSPLYSTLPDGRLGKLMDTSRAWEPMHFDFVPVHRETGFILSDEIEKVEENIEEEVTKESEISEDVAK